MQEQVQIAFRGMDTPMGIEDSIRSHVAHLETFFNRITACKVLVEPEHKRHHQGNLYHVRVDLVVPGREIVVKREPSAHHANEDIHVAIKDAFDAAKRQLQDYVREMRGDIKAHVEPEVGEITHLAHDKGYGFLRTSEGNELYLHKNAVVGGKFDDLHVGDKVRYVADAGEDEKGPHASTVIPL
jgi:cold shock CspA family protein/ribosome-associated translation inhibitor RaiA